MRNGNMTEENKSEMEADFQESFTGVEGTRFILNFADAGDANTPKVDVIPNDNRDKNFLLLSEDTKSNIFIGHSVSSPIVMGVIQINSLNTVSAYSLGSGYNTFNFLKISIVVENLKKR